MTHTLFLFVFYPRLWEEKKKQEQGEEHGQACFRDLSCLFGNRFFVPSQMFMGKSLCQTLNFCAQKGINCTHPYGKLC